ncbi:MAG TPA: FAD-dependent thymidylate synthase [Bacteroidota bacterium]|nr:FAD-dependent thymidylate synthase [Bacteroidota bacterium]HRT67955.1 FAD-dependent thymidylate synthase [Bacteroidota bacterium]
MENNAIAEVIGKEYKCLDKGFVRLVDVMGDDSSIVQAARVSYGKGTKSFSEDRGLIRYLMRHSHTSPFEMVELKFHVKLPIFVARQWIRHRTANVNEYSGRYSEMRDEFYLPDANQIRSQSSDNKQGRSEDELAQDVINQILQKMQNLQKASYSDYIYYLENNLARELARINLPLSTYTEWYWKIDLHNLFHFLKLRMDTHAQYEIRAYADIIAEIIKQILPISYEAFEDYELNAIRFSKNELEVLADLIDKAKLTNIQASDYGFTKSEWKELEEKFNKFIKNKE